MTDITCHPVPYQPMSENQYGLWLLQTLNPTMSAYNIASVFRVSAPLDGAALQRALQQVVCHHPLLRTTFTLQNERPMQCLHAELTPQFEVVDASDMSQEMLQSQVQAAHDRPFDLSTGPLVRLTLFRRTSTDQVVLFNSHHILLDFKSQAQITQELLAAYQDETQGEISQRSPRPSPASVEGASYNEFVSWQQAFLASEQSQRHQHYWRKQLQSPLPVLTLPTDRPYPPQQSYQGASLPICLSNDLTQGVLRVAEQKTVTPFIVLLAAYTLLLARYSRQEELIVGIASSERLRLPPRFQQTLGHLVNLLPVRFTLSADTTFVDLLQQTQKVVMGGLFYQNYPFAHMVRDAQRERDPSRSPLFEVSFNMPTLDTAHDLVSLLTGSPDNQMGSRIVQGLPIAPYPLQQLAAQVPLHLDMWQEGEQLVGYFKYNSDLFDEATIARLVGHFEVLLNGIVAQPDQPVFHLPMLTEAEVQQIVYEWNDTSVDFGPAQTIHALFEQQVARTPDAVAVIMAEDKVTRWQGDKVNTLDDVTVSPPHPVTLSYAELNARANQLAHHLIILGVQPDTLVAVMMERSIEMVVSLLAVLKAGGAYVPIDPTYPQERIAFMLADSAAPILLTQSYLSPAQEGAQPIKHHITVDTMLAQWADQPTHNPQTPTLPSDLAYVIYTSGSTGQPKGAANQHDGVFNRLRWTQQQFQLTAGVRVLQKTPFSFDVSVWEFFWTLMSGACLVVAQPEGHKDPAYLREVIQQQQITLLHFVPSMLQQFITTGSVQLGSSLRAILTSGEALSLELAQTTQRVLPNIALHNLYGPTEAAVDVSHWTYHDNASTIPIGKPIANTTLYVLDDSARLLPIGVAGELYIGGIQLARCYLNRPDLTAERFITHPEFGRLYKTGDLCRWLPDGNIEYIGRTDFQVKIRGFRIELGEIESALLSQEGVREAVVMARDDTPGDKRLVAYLVGELESETLRKNLAQQLPEYMIPATFVRLASMPLTPNGKLDRKSLPTPNYTENQTTFVAPRNALEEQLVAIWAEMLDIQRIGVHDNFFALGGHSLMAMRLVNALQNQFKETIHITALFEAPTVSQLAAYLYRYYPQTVENLVARSENEQERQSQPEVHGDGARTAGSVIDETAYHKVQALFAAPASTLLPCTPSKNQPAIFLLSAPRTGSTLLRVILAGHPRLFAPPELGLLGYQTLQERRAANRDLDPSLMDGPIYALSEITNLDFAATRTLMEEFEARQLTIPQVYHELQIRLGERRLVDKTPHYALDLAVLRAAEATFANNHYLFLVRHPYGMIHSFDEARLDLLWPLRIRQQLPYSRLQLAELVWLLSYQNLRTFANELPPERRHWVRFEDLVSDPQTTVTSICDFLQIQFQPAMLQPYLERKQRMTATVDEGARMLGDIKFHQHTVIEANAAKSWHQHYTSDFLSKLTWQVAQTFGYAPIQRAPIQRAPIQRAPDQQRPETIQRISQITVRPTQAPITQLSDQEVNAQLQALLRKRALAKEVRA